MKTYAFLTSIIVPLSLLSASSADVKIALLNLSTSVIKATNGLSGLDPDFGSKNASFSDDGRYLVFESDATNLVSSDSNGISDIFLFDSQTSTTTKISQGMSNSASNGTNFQPKISGDGNYIVFASNASNLVSGDTNNAADIFLFKRSDSTIIRLSVNSTGTQSNGGSGEPSISRDGNLITFTSLATNLVPSDTNNVKDVFVKNRTTGAISLVSTDSSANQANKASYQSAINSDGTMVAFASDASNLISSDSNGCSDVFVKTISSGAIQLVSSSPASVIGNRSSDWPAISKTGQFVAFQSRANNLIATDTNAVVDVFRKDISSGQVLLASQSSNGDAATFDAVRPSISLDGRYITFESKSSNFDINDTNGLADTFIRDTQAEYTSIFSSSTAGIIGNQKSVFSKISGDGSKVAFETTSNNLGFTNSSGAKNIFIRPYSLSLPIVKVLPLGNLNESGIAQNAFQLSRFGDTSQSLTVSYSVAGVATPGTDYQALSGTALFAAGSATTIIQITPYTDTEVETDESIILSITDQSGYVVSRRTASVNILNDDDFGIEITAINNTATEDGMRLGKFQIARTGGTLGDLTVNLVTTGTATSGIDYVALPTSILIPAGNASVTLQVQAIEDDKSEGDETVILSIAAGPGYHAGTSPSATVTILDNDKHEVNLKVLDSVLDKANASDTGKVQFDRGFKSSDVLVINYSLKGTAVNGVDYQTLSGQVTIPSNSQTVTLEIFPITTATRNGSQTLILECLPGKLYDVGASNVAAFTVRGDSLLPRISVTATQPITVEGSSTYGNFRFSRTGDTSQALAVSYAIGGTATNGIDYSAISGSISFAAGSAVVDLSIQTIDDAIVEPTESVIVALQSSSSYTIDQTSSTAEVDILDNDPPSVAIFKRFDFVDGQPQSFGAIELRRIGDLSSALTVGLSYSGDAIKGVDFVDPGSTVVMPAGQSIVRLTLTPIIQPNLSISKSSLITLAPSANYSLNQTTSVQLKLLNPAMKVVGGIVAVDGGTYQRNASVSDDGRYIVFESDRTDTAKNPSGLNTIYWVDTQLKQLFTINGIAGSAPNGPSRKPVISADGRKIAFSSKASNLVNDDINLREDIFIFDIASSTFTCVSNCRADPSVSGDSLNPSISSNGRFLAFQSSSLAITGDADTNLSPDIFLYDNEYRQSVVVSRKTDQTQLTGRSELPSVSDDGRYVVFQARDSSAPDDGFTNIYLKDLQTGTLKNISAAGSGTTNTGSSVNPKLSGNGSTVVYESKSSNIVFNDLNNATDVIMYTVSSGVRKAVSIASSGQTADQASFQASVDRSGAIVGFVSYASNLISSIKNNCGSIFVRSVNASKNFSVVAYPAGSCSVAPTSAFLSANKKFIGYTTSNFAGGEDLWITSNVIE